MQNAVNRLISHVANHGIRHVVICPGSRNAPLTLAFSRHSQFECYALVDERSAAFTALGMAVAIGKPVAIVCTSGTAVLNFYPAIAEAYYSQIPLLIITADRPANWIDQWDGQCIRQTNIFEKHILGSFTYDPLNANDAISKAIALCSFPTKGPVHINVPISEPIYEAKNLSFQYPEWPQEAVFEKQNVSSLPDVLPSDKIIILAGADAWGQRHQMWFDSLESQGKIVLIADVISGLHETQTLKNWDILLTIADEKLKADLKPELLISIGKFTVSKGLKNFIRQHQPIEHWHITDNHTIANPFQTNLHEIMASEADFLNWLLSNSSHIGTSYVDAWKSHSKVLEKKMESLIAGNSFNEFTATNHILSKLPKPSTLHVGNSMPIRYISFLANTLDGLKVYGNRGTSGIEGSLSTAVGNSMMHQQLTVILLGDMSFFYDINALWNKYLRSNFKIIVLNNGGGGIFRLMDGPSDLPECEDYFATQSARTCKRMAEEFNINYFHASDFVTLQHQLTAICNDKTRAGILEVEVNSALTIEFYKKFTQLNINPNPQLDN